MSFSYTSRDAYNGCLSLFSQSEAEHRGLTTNFIDKIKISGNVSKTHTGYEFKISRITPAQRTNNSKPRLNDDSLDETDQAIFPSYPQYDGTTDYIIPSSAYAKIILTTDISLFPDQQNPRYTVTLEITNLDYSDLNAWPYLSEITLLGNNISRTEDSCSVSLGESWSLCDTHSDLGSEAGGDWELVSMAAIGNELQEMSIQHDNSEKIYTNGELGKEMCTIKKEGFSYADVVKKDAPNLTSRELGAEHRPKRKYSEHKWEPTYQVRAVSRMDVLLRAYAAEKCYDYGWDDDDLHESEDYDYAKSFGNDARSNMIVANIAYSRQKEAGIISVGSRSKSIK